ncbi:hypothetical protein E4Z66_14045 [Aliishimia ponticola]|uniref:Uncharacterized protein n=1 Tax=Aliishimia ponticola TaxID=2499833 RepID=A0A4S4NAC0_9RHOB|nr:glycosyl hydrolase 108 family protein [Aliishimia ponticola]THH36169.1 hypothetical protein E4Z66_14045 [Aliishimia ponticola]
MSNSSARDGDISRLHPAIRDKVQAIRDKLNDEGIRFEVFEAFRSPERQEILFAKGRNKPGPKVTWVRGWGSIHQYGLAVDFVLKDRNGRWSWNDTGANAKKWTRMHELAKEHGMTPLFNKAGKLIEKPHIQLIGVSARDLRKGKYPEGGDGVWAECLATLIDNWEGSGAPPKPDATPERPGLDDELVAQMEAEAGTVHISTSGPALAVEGAQDDARFQKLHAFIRQWEGGFVDNPHDAGGATNMGVTQATLSAWRKTDVTVEDVRNLTRAEADAILRTNYYNLCRCGELPDRSAMVLYNAAVLHGPKRAVMMLQAAFNDLGMTADGEPLEIDGILGRITVTAIRQTDASVLATAFMDLQDAYFRAHEDFEHFGAGWLNRLTALRSFVDTLPQGAGLRPKTVMKISDRRLDIDGDDLLRIALAGATGGKSAVLGAVLGKALKKDVAEGDSQRRSKAMLRALLEDKLDLELIDPDTIDPRAQVKKVLTPVNAALGQTVGRLLDGKKSVIGIAGLIAAAVIPELGLQAPGSPQLTELLDGDSQTIIFTLLTIFTGWGFLGKVDKAIRDVRTGLA